MHVIGWTRDMHQRARESTVFCFIPHEIPWHIVVLTTEFFICSTISKIPDPLVPMLCSYQSLELVCPMTLSAKIDLGHREMPSAKMFCTPAICFALWFHPPASSRLPSILMSRHALLSLAPPHRVTHNTAARLSPLINMGSPLASGRSPTSSSMTHAVTTIPSNSNRFIVMVQVSWQSVIS